MYIIMRRILFLTPLALVFISLNACKWWGPRDAGFEFAPQMYHPIAPEPYNQREYNPYFADGKNMQAAPTGAVARGKMDYYYPYPKTNEGYEQAGKELKNPLPSTPENVDEGKRLYSIYCQHCHGESGKGDGPIIKAEKFPNPPPYDGPRVKALSDGKMFHSITYGINVMGAHGSQLSPAERWKIIHFIKSVRGEPIEAPKDEKDKDKTASDSTAKAAKH